MSTRTVKRSPDFALSVKMTRKAKPVEAPAPTIGTPALLDQSAGTLTLTQQTLDACCGVAIASLDPPTLDVTWVPVWVPAVVDDPAPTMHTIDDVIIVQRTDQTPLGVLTLQASVNGQTLLPALTVDIAECSDDPCAGGFDLMPHFVLDDLCDTRNPDGSITIGLQFGNCDSLLEYEFNGENAVIGKTFCFKFDRAVEYIEILSVENNYAVANGPADSFVLSFDTPSTFSRLQIGEFSGTVDLISARMIG